MSRFDLKDAYLQFELDKESSMMIVINTHRGRYRFKRLPPELEFLGFQFTNAGIRPTDEKVKALQQMRYPENREELQTYLGLLRKGVKFEFTEECKRALDEAKLVMSKKPCLAFYDESLPVVVACDGSRKGIGAGLLGQQQNFLGSSMALPSSGQVFVVSRGSAGSLFSGQQQLSGQ
ncbi:Hypothetical predicted protein [Cloeon dipterum]|uniref:Reverse transcriptase/retrotransposon-derived protein RNase H-like domain-containing protein n=1 Tax=Cloeon dipterum TaxID=197152 RepID=A0A8S1CI68_9INSE|nr:Hypothetical predicted protein [Cloeon dipterum]